MVNVQKAETRQARYQRRNHERGLCYLCPKPIAAGSAWHCAKHQRKTNTRSLERYRTGHPEAKMKRCHKCGKLGHYVKTCVKKGATTK